MQRHPDKSAETEKQITVSHPIPPVWNSENKILILGTMPSPKSREAGFFYMHPQNRFWNVLSEVFRETFKYKNNGIIADVALPAASTQKSAAAPDISAAIDERHDFLLRHHLAMWDVLASCGITGAADSSIKNAIPNDFSEIVENSKVRKIICTGKTSFNLWQKKCAALYEPHYNLTVHCLPSTSPANAQWTKEKLVEEYKAILKLIHE